MIREDVYEEILQQERNKYPKLLQWNLITKIIAFVPVGLLIIESLLLLLVSPKLGLMLLVFYGVLSFIYARLLLVYQDTGLTNKRVIMLFVFLGYVFIKNLINHTVFGLITNVVIVWVCLALYFNNKIMDNANRRYTDAVEFDRAYGADIDRRNTEPFEQRTLSDAEELAMLDKKAARGEDISSAFKSPYDSDSKYKPNNDPYGLKDDNSSTSSSPFASPFKGYTPAEETVEPAKSSTPAFCPVCGFSLTPGQEVCGVCNTKINKE